MPTIEAQFLMRLQDAGVDWVPVSWALDAVPGADPLVFPSWVPPALVTTIRALYALGAA